MKVIIDDFPLDGYKRIASEIVARAVDDYVTIHVFLRNDRNGRYRELYQERADECYTRLQKTLEQRVRQKRETRMKLKDNLAKISEYDARKAELKKTLSQEEHKLREASDKLFRLKQRTAYSKQASIEKTRNMFDLKQDIAMHKATIDYYEKKIKELEKEAKPYRKQVYNCRDKLAEYKQSEKSMKHGIRPSHYHVIALQSAIANEANLLKWFDSEQFEILTDKVTKTYIIDMTEKAVNETGVDRAVKDIFFL